MGKVVSEPWILENMPTCYDIKLQTRTFSYQLPHTLDLFSLFNRKSGIIAKNKLVSRSIYEKELFSSRSIFLHSGGCINLFMSGKMILLGNKDSDEWLSIINQLFKN